MSRKSIRHSNEKESIFDTVLERVALNPGINAYQIAAISPKLDRITVMRCLRRNFWGKDFVSVEKGKRNADCFRLTLYGILFVLHKKLVLMNGEKDDYDFIRKFIKTYERYLWMTFGKWDHFKKEGVEDLAFLRLKAICGRLNLGDIPGFAFERGGALVTMGDPRTKLDWLFYFIGLIPVDGKTPEDRTIRNESDRWIEALKKDEEITIYFLQELERYQERLRYYSGVGEKITEQLLSKNPYI